VEQNLKVDGKTLFSTSAKTDDDGSQKNQKTSTTVAKLTPGGGQIADIKILKSLAGYLWMKDNLEFQFRVVAALFLLVGAKVSGVW
jgi:ABC transporter ATM